MGDMIDLETFERQRRESEFGANLLKAVITNLTQQLLSSHPLRPFLIIVIC